MGRTLKRVPLDFAWPLKKTWQGYLNPYTKFQIKCTECDETGLSPKARLFSDQWYGKAPFDPVAYGAVALPREHPQIRRFAERNVSESPAFYGRGESAVQLEITRLWELWRGQWGHHLIQADVDALVAADRLWDFTRVPLNDEQKANCHPNGWTKESNGHAPTADEVNAWSIGGMGHDSCNQWICLRARCERDGVTLECAACKGQGHTWPNEEVHQMCENWKDIEPPTGPGYQLWETTSEGSPISPVFTTLDALCSWAADNSSTFGSFRASKEQWRKMLEDDFVHAQQGNAIFM